MGCQGCRGFIAFLLKFLNFIQTFIGASMILYSVWMLNHWQSHVHPPPPIAPSPNNYDTNYDLPAELMFHDSSIGQLEVPLSSLQMITSGDHLQFRKLGQHSSGLTAGFDVPKHNLPAPWFIYTFLGLGIIVCLITCFGHIAAEITNGCCLCCYSVLIIILILMEASCVGDIFFNHHWEKDIPEDPTGEFKSIKKFIEENIDICKWVGLAVVIIQAFSLLLAMILRAMVAPRKPDYDSDEDYIPPRGNSRQPLLSHQGSQAPSASVMGENRSNRADVWSKRMREKYGLNTNEFTYDSSDPKTSASTTTPTDDTERRCAIM
eukprot:Gb_12923 [translate_table: standard]